MGKIIFFSSLTTQMLVRGNVLENLLNFAVLHWRHEKKLQIVKGQINSKENLQKSFKEGFETKTQVVPKVWGWENSSPLSCHWREMPGMQESYCSSILEFPVPAQAQWPSPLQASPERLLRFCPVSSKKKGTQLI